MKTCSICLAHKPLAEFHAQAGRGADCCGERGGDRMNEVLVKVPGWPEYEISRRGQISRSTAARGTRPGRPLKPQIDRNGYHRVMLYRNGVGTGFLVHRLVAYAFIDSQGIGYVCHEDGDPGNNTPENLRFDTQQSNMDDAVRMGRVRRGERHGMNRYSESQMKDAKARLNRGESFSSVARDIGCNESHMRKLKQGRTWAWL